MGFTPRLNKPESGNKFYITKSSGGYSSAIVGKPTDSCNVLANCVGYAHGRFHEIANDTKMSYLSPVNAEDFPEYAKNCTTGTTPKLGSIIVWKKGKTGVSSDGAGHVAVVERIISDTQILVSSSGYNNSKIFWTEIVTKSNNTWKCSWMGSEYIFRCFIYNPAVSNTESTVVTLMNGSTGAAVKTLQTQLNTVGNYNLVVDGSYGAKTEAAVKDFQKQNSLTVDGICGPATQVALTSVINKLNSSTSDSSINTKNNLSKASIKLDNKTVKCTKAIIGNNLFIKAEDLVTLGIIKSFSYNDSKNIFSIISK